MSEPTKSKAEELLAAARARNQKAEAIDQKEPAKSAVEKEAKEPEIVEQKIAAAEEMAETRVQAKAGTLTGEIDVEAMGDVKGDGRDAKDYPDTDPDKHLGVPTYEHGLGSNKPLDQPDDSLSSGVVGARTNSRREAEMARGRERIAEINKGREQAETRRAERESSPFRTTAGDPTPEELRAAKKGKKASK
jgi:hypothetical protein